jgi:hypothetical protein
MSENKTNQASGVVDRLGVIAVLALALGSIPTSVQAQEVKWMAAGSLNNWFSSTGCEIEVGRSSAAEQQDGLQWPAWFAYQDMQAAKGLWIGTANWTDTKSTSWTHKVVHVGPRVRGTGEFIPVIFTMIAKYDQPLVTVDGSVSMGKDPGINTIDPSLKPDRMIVNIVSTAIGITMTRKIMQFSQQYHDNYMIFDYTFTNTGDVNGDNTSELPKQTLTGVYFYFQYRYSVCADTRYVIGGATGWGKNAMNDARGDGFSLPTTNAEDTDDSVNIPGVYTSRHLRTQFVWHGKFPPFTQYDNIGGPIWIPYYDPSDTTGRLGAAQFCGHVTIHADHSASDTTDDPGQPSTMSWEGSDEPNTSGNDQYNASRMDDEYTNWIQRGHKKPRHAWAVEPQGKFDEPTGDPALVTPGGYSNCDGYGPYTLAPGQSVHIVMAEGASGLSRDKCISVGREFKAGQLTAKAKDDSVLTGKDSLFQTFRRAIANYRAGLDIPQPPPPPNVFNVTSGEPITLTWDVANASDPNLKGFRIYRSTGRPDGQYTPLVEAGPADRSYGDTSAQRGVAYYYYIVSVGDPASNHGASLAPGGPLVSNRIYTQTYDPAYFKAKRKPGGTMLDIRIVPNPYSIVSDPTRLRFEGEPNKIAFLDIPGQCRIRIYTELGELIRVIEHSNGSGDEYWDSYTSSRQIIVSGIYIVLFEDLSTGERAMRKLAVIR